MTLSLIIVGSAAALALLLWVAARGQAAAVRELDELAGHTRPVDLAAFRNLVDPAEEAYLRAHLPPRVFREVQRERLRAAAEYVARAAQNAAVLLRLGQAMRHAEGAEVSGAARELMENALRLRVYALLALMLLYARMAVPGARLSPTGIVDRYEGLVERLGRLSRLRQPAYSSRISAAV